MKRIVVALACATAMQAGAAGNDELWEVGTQMNMAGMPAGMGAHTSQVCTEKGDPRSAVTKARNMEKCKLTDFKESGSRITMTVSCPEGTGVIDNTYNAERTEYHGTMKMTTKQGEMTMTMNGRKIGTCDAQVAKTERDAKTATIMGQVAQSQAIMAQTEEMQVRECNAAVEMMQMSRLGQYSQCSTMPGYCESMAASDSTKKSANTCMAKAGEFCKRYQTMDGFLKANGDDAAATMCKVSREGLRASHCGQALKTENLAFLAHLCPAEARPLVQQHCAGRSYTGNRGGKYAPSA